MSEEKKNIPVDPLAPEIPEKAKVPETPSTRVEQQLKKAKKKVVEFQKDVKFLWIYSTVFCLAMLSLIGASYIIQQKIHSEVDTYKSQAESAELSNEENQSRLSGIQEENKRLKGQVENLTAQNENLKAGAEKDEALIGLGEEMLTQQNQLLRAVHLYEQGEEELAKEAFAQVNKSKLPADSVEIYTYYEERLK